MRRSAVRGLLGFLFAVALATVPASAESSGRTEGWLGVSLVPVRADGDPNGAPVRGALAQGIVEGSPAERAGVRSRDVIVSIDGQPVTSPSDVVERIRSLEPGSWVSLLVERGGRERSLDVRLLPRPDGTERLAMVRGYIGADAIDLPASLREHFGAPSDAGVLISAIAPGSPAERAGLSIGDVVYEADGEPVRSMGGFARLVAGSGVGNEIEIRLARSGARIVIEVSVEKAPERGD